MAGEPSSPVTVVLYVALEGARSGDLVIALHQEVCSGRLKGKAKLIIRPILVEGGDEDAARAVTAAADQGKLWPFLVRLYGQETPLSRSTLRRCASLVGDGRRAPSMPPSTTRRPTGSSPPPAAPARRTA